MNRSARALQIFGMLSAASTIAAARLVPTGQETAAKVHVKANTSEMVDFTVRVQARVSAGAATPESRFNAAHEVDMSTTEVLLRILRKAGIAEAKLERLAGEVLADVDGPADLLEAQSQLIPLHHALDRVAAAGRKRFGNREVVVPPKPARISCDVLSIDVLSDVRPDNGDAGSGDAELSLAA